MKPICIAALVLVVTPAWAVNINVFKDAPITRLTGEEVKAFRAEVMKVLDTAADGATVEWRAPKTRFASKITPHSRFADGKFNCREATIESDAHDLYQRGRYTFCKGEKGDWQFRFPAGASKAKSR